MKFTKKKFLNIRLGILWFSFLYITPCIGQSDCTPDSSYYTDIVRSDGEEMPVLFNFIFSEDSMAIYPGRSHSYPIISFKILERKCLGSKPLVDGVISMRLFLKEEGTEKHASLNIAIVNQIAQYIEIIYDDMEKRVFLIAQKK